MSDEPRDIQSPSSISSAALLTTRFSAVLELLASMRFAIALLTLICIASVIGTIITQHEPLNNYVNQFGPFWAAFFDLFSLFSVYSAWWFLLILAFLVLSLSLCIARNLPKIMQELRTFKEHIRSDSLRAFHYKANANFSGNVEDTARLLMQKLTEMGWNVKAQQRTLDSQTLVSQNAMQSGVMVAAKKGSSNKLGYLAAHGAVVLICVGGLLDGDLVVRLQTWFDGKSLYQGGGLIADVPRQHWLSENNPSFRGNILVSEGTKADTAILNQSGGILLQPLPFAIELKKFEVEHYSTGMPKLFASEILLHDKEGGNPKPARIEVNHPFEYRGVSIFQSSFEDGGSGLTLSAMPMKLDGEVFEVNGSVGGSTELVSAQNDKISLEFTGLRVFNIEDLSAEISSDGSSNLGGSRENVLGVRKTIEARLGAGNKTSKPETLRNVGPSVSYKLRDSAGQAREYNNYMQAVNFGEGKAPVYLLGMRENPNEEFRYLRIPSDPVNIETKIGEIDGPSGFFALLNAMQNAELRSAAAQNYAQKAAAQALPESKNQLAETASKTLAIYAGANVAGGANTLTGLQALSEFLEKNVPEAEREKTGEVLLRVLNGSIFELDSILRSKDGRKPLPQNEVGQDYITQSVLALSDIAFYPAPMAFMLKDFKQVQASVFQVSKAPGRWVVYTGSILLIIGIFVMLYIRERRVWLWVSADNANANLESNQQTSKVTVQLAFSSNRQTMDTDTEFQNLKAHLL